MQLKHIGFTALVTLLAGVSTPVLAVTGRGYTPQAQPPKLLAVSGIELTQTQTVEFEQWFNQGNALLNKQKYTEALKAFEQALRLNPNQSEAWFGRGEALYALQRYEDAIAAYRQALKLNPQSIAAWGE